jgi:glycosyltransferase involved in cell wall biosynthesis
MSSMNVLYVYDRVRTISFTLVAQKHIEYMRKLGTINVREIPIYAFPLFKPDGRYVAVVHPFVYVWSVISNEMGNVVDIAEVKNRYEKIVGVYVCDTDRMSREAVNVLNEADVLVVPSMFCVDVFRRSGVKKTIYRVPHGVDESWYLMQNVWVTQGVKGLSVSLVQLYQYKQRTGKKLLLWWFWHSWIRKGGPWVKAVYERLVRRRSDVKLVVKTSAAQVPELRELVSLGIVQVYGWLKDVEKMALYDLADVTLMFSTGGAFELNGLESLARNVPAVAVDWGPWTEYIPPFLRIKPGERVRPLSDNNVHVGYGYAVDVNDAVAKIEDILDNYEEYRAKVDEWRRKVLYPQYRWDVVAEQLVSVISVNV